MKFYFKLIVIGATLCAGNIFAQVGMTGNAPNNSAAIDIDAKNKGLLISSVSLTNTSDITTVDSPANSLLIYNSNAAISGSGAAGTGYYYWDNVVKLWKKLAGMNDFAQNPWKVNGNAGTNPATDFLGTKDSKPLIIKTSNEERLRINSNGNVGIGTTNDAYKLQVAGEAKIDSKLFLNNVATAPNEGASQLVRDNNTGKVYAMSTGVGTKAYNYIKYSLNNVAGDWVANFNTKIPVDTYTVIVVGNAFKIPNKSGMNGAYGGQFNPLNVNAFPENGTWRLYADYNGGAPASGNGSWDIYLLVINNNSVAKLSDMSFNLGGRSSATGTMPSGL